MAVSTARVSLVFLSFITISYRLPCVVLGKGSRISMATHSNGLTDGITEVVSYACICSSFGASPTLCDSAI